VLQGNRCPALGTDLRSVGGIGDYKEFTAGGTDETAWDVVLLLRRFFGLLGFLLIEISEFFGAFPGEDTVDELRNRQPLLDGEQAHGLTQASVGVNDQPDTLRVLG
jgi:hypothetical protein